MIFQLGLSEDLESKTSGKLDDGTVGAEFKLSYNDVLVRLFVFEEIVEIFLKIIGLILYIVCW